MKKYLTSVAIVVSVIFGLAACEEPPAYAESPPTPTDFDGDIHGDSEYADAYWESRICFAATDAGETLPVMDTWRSPELNEPYMNWGSISGPAPMPCIPTDCPAGFTLISGNACSGVDPFAHVPFEDEVVQPATESIPEPQMDTQEPEIEPKPEWLTEFGSLSAAMTAGYFG